MAKDGLIRYIDFRCDVVSCNTKCDLYVIFTFNPMLKGDLLCNSNF
jgi:hypothetical protein